MLRLYPTPTNLRPQRCLLLAVILFACMGTGLWAQITDVQQCFKCHGDVSLINKRPESLKAMVRIPAGESPVYRSADEVPPLLVTEQAFNASVHGGLGCVECHPGIDRLPHTQHVVSLACRDCHVEAADSVMSGAHGPGQDAGARQKPDCMTCHGDPHQVQRIQEKRDYDQLISLTHVCMDCHDQLHGDTGSHAETYRDNVHGHGLFSQGLALSATCFDCHGAHNILPATNPSSPMYPLNQPETCGKCHQGIEEIYFQSVHGEHLRDEVQQGATCGSCHSSHGIGKIDEQFMQHIVQECSHCHADLGRSYLASYHGKATSLGGSAAAVCSSCHGSHAIRKIDEPESMVHPSNLEQTCAKCHDNVNSNFTQYIAHADIRNKEKNFPVYITWLAMTTLLLSVLAVFIPHGLLWFQRSFVERLRNPVGFHAAPKTVRRIRRFRMIHRITHALIVISFMGLVITGFPLKYSYTEWAHTFASALGGAHVMGILHRIFAIITFLYAGVHGAFLVYFFMKECPKPRWKYIFGPDSMMFSLKDLKDFIAMVRWFFWLGPRPKFDRWTYFEKFDYFGEIWGVFLIGGTGLILWFPTLFTRWLPGWVLNCAMVIHSIEALLAASVIFLVHFFNTHLRPEKFPIDMVMLTGSMTEEEMKEERPAEYERYLKENRLEERIVEPIALHWRIVGAIFGMIAFLTGIALIALAIRTEFTNVFG